jgi:hypothetical protein
VAEDVLSQGLVDLVGVARPIIADPDWPKKWREGREKEIRKCIYCCHCIDTQRHFLPLSCPRWGDGRNGDGDFAYSRVPEGYKIEGAVTYDKLPYKGHGYVYVPHVEGFPPRE